MNFFFRSNEKTRLVGRVSSTSTIAQQCLLSTATIRLIKHSYGSRWGVTETKDQNQKNSVEKKHKQGT